MHKLSSDFYDFFFIVADDDRIISADINLSITMKKKLFKWSDYEWKSVEIAINIFM